ncbi:MAG TPA: hypothetical protein VFA83_18155 [Acidimicrobiales bacterium]|nr:hypothetical protein [Acidimicrobiales bacterium]
MQKIVTTDRGFVDSIASQPGITSFDPAQCDDVLSGLAGGISGASIYALRADGSVLCQLEDASVTSTASAASPPR